MDHRPIGGSGIEISALSLGSWRTFERSPREHGLAVMTAARESGIDFLDDARYNDEPPSPRRQKAFEVGERLLGLADKMGTTPLRLAIAFALANPRAASVLFSATSPEQVAENVGALEVFSRMDEASLGRLRSIQPTVAD